MLLGIQQFTFSIFQQEYWTPISSTKMGLLLQVLLWLLSA